MTPRDSAWPGATARSRARPELAGELGQPPAGGRAARDQAGVERVDGLVKVHSLRAVDGAGVTILHDFAADLAIARRRASSVGQPTSPGEARCSRKRSSTRRSPRRATARSPSTSAPITPASGTPPTGSAATRSPRPRSTGRRASRPRAMDYTDEEHEVWRTVCRELARQARALRLPRVPRGRGGARRCPTDRVPQLDEVSERPAAADRLRATTRPPGSSRCDEFYGSLGDGVFHSTQYLRHPPRRSTRPSPTSSTRSSATATCSPTRDFAELNRLAGHAAQRVETDEALQFLADVFWFTIEFGVMWEDGELRAYGAGHPVSYGEIEEFRTMEIRPLDLARDGHAALRHHPLPADPVRAPTSMDAADRRAWAASSPAFDDDTPARLEAAHSTAGDGPRATMEPSRSRAASR